jgi:hypothetical protein
MTDSDLQIVDCSRVLTQVAEGGASGRQRLCVHVMVIEGPGRHRDRQIGSLPIVAEFAGEHKQGARRVIAT